MKLNYLKMAVGFSLTMTSQMFFAQSPVSASDLNPQNGDVFQYHTVNYVSPGNAGLNQTWDFSGMTELTLSPGISAINVSTPGSKGLDSIFTTSNIIEETQGGSFVMKTSNNALQITGAIISGENLIYSNFENILVYPLTINETHTDTWEANLSIQGFSLNRSGSTTVTVDGYGTLITPKGTYENVYRVHIEQDYTDSGYSNSHYQNHQYSWYKAGIHSHIAMLTDYYVDGSNSYSRGAYLENQTLDVNQLTTNQTKIFPNPANEKLTISFDKPQSLNSSVTISDLLGNIVYESKLSELNQSLIVDTQQFAEGFYNVTILVENQVISNNKVAISRK